MNQTIIQTTRTALSPNGKGTDPSLVTTKDGLTLRDYFAAKAMQGFISDPNLPTEPTKVATASYKMADAMLAQRAVE